VESGRLGDAASGRRSRVGSVPDDGACRLGRACPAVRAYARRRRRSRPAELAKFITPILAKDGSDITYTEDVEALTPERLAQCDVLLIYRDHGDLPPKPVAALLDPEAALLDFVESSHR
jgi:hypothetical protein